MSFEFRNLNLNGSQRCEWRCHWRGRVIFPACLLCFVTLPLAVEKRPSCLWKRAPHSTTIARPERKQTRAFDSRERHEHENYHNAMRCHLENYAFSVSSFASDCVYGRVNMCVYETNNTRQEVRAKPAKAAQSKAQRNTQTALHMHFLKTEEDHDDDDDDDDAEVRELAKCIYFACNILSTHCIALR